MVFVIIEKFGISSVAASHPVLFGTPTRLLDLSRAFHRTWQASISGFDFVGAKRDGLAELECPISSLIACTKCGAADWELPPNWCATFRNPSDDPGPKSAASP